MAVTQSDALNWLNTRVGLHLDYDNQAGQQCFDFFNYYYQHLTGENPYSVGYAVPSAYMIWGIANDNFSKIPDSANLLPQPGDIAIYGTAWGAGNGHVEVVAETDSTGCTFIGENEHNNASEGVVRVHRTFAQMRGLIGVLRPRWLTNEPAPQPTQKYTVIEEYPTGKQIKLNKQPTNLWGMNFDFDYMKDHPIEVHNQGEIWTVTNKVHHIDGYDYYRRDGQVDGFNVSDCDDYTPPPPPYVPPAAPVPVTKAETYEVLCNLPAYTSADEVAKAKNPVDVLKPGKYYVWDKKGSNNNYWNVSTSNIKNDGTWINTTSNKKALNPPLPPAPKPVVVVPPPTLKPSEVPIGAANDTAWKSSYSSFHADRHSESYKLLQHWTMKEYSGKRNNVPLQTGQTINIVGTFTKNGVLFYRPRANNDEYFSWFFGVPQVDDDGNAVLVKVTSDLNLAEKRLADYYHYWKSDLKDVFDIFVKKIKK